MGEKQKVEKKKKKKKEKKVGENNDQLRFHPPPQEAHASRLDQNHFDFISIIISSPVTGLEGCLVLHIITFVSIIFRMEQNVQRQNWMDVSSF